MRRRIGQKILLLFITSVFILTAFPMTSLAAPSGSATPNCWGSGGQLEIQSEQGKGTTCYVMIPCEMISREKKTEIIN